MAHLPALCARFPAYCWVWFTNMEPVSRRYQPGWFHVGVTLPHDGGALWVDAEFRS